MTEMVERIVKIIEQRSENAYTVERNANLPISSISAWKKDKFKPSTEAIIKLATYFNVSADYLLCLSDEPTPLKTADIIERPDYALSTELAKLSQDERFVNSAKLYKELPNKYREEVYALIRGIAIGFGLNIQQILGK